MKRGTIVYHIQELFSIFHNIAVSEIKLLFCALAGCTSHKTVHPEIAPCTLPIYSNDKWLKKCAHTGCTPQKNHAPGRGNVHAGCRVHP